MKFTNYDHYSPRRQNNLQRWEALAERGDPFLLALDRDHAALAPPDPATVASILGTADASPWGVANLLRRWVFSAARLWGHPDSVLFGRTDWLEGLGALIDGVVDRMDPAGHWVAPGEADPNANRFVLTSLLSALVDLHGQSEGAGVVDRHAVKLTAAVDFQREAYRPGSALHEKDYGARFSPRYPNMDLSFIAILGMGAKLLDRPDWAQEAHETMARVQANVLPGGGIHYLKETTEAPDYHRINTTQLRRYLEVSGDPEAALFLRRLAGYLPTVLTADGVAEHWSGPSWKQDWMRAMALPELDPYAAGPLAVSIHHAPESERPPLLRLFGAALSRIDPEAASPSFGQLLPGLEWQAWGIGLWPFGASADLAPSEASLDYDNNRLGFRGQSGGWYYGVAKGRGQRNTLVGGLLNRFGADGPRRSAFRGVWAEVETGENTGRHKFWVSRDRPALPPTLSWLPERAAVAARHTLQPARFGKGENLSPSVWTLRQSWVASAGGTVGHLRLDASEAAPAAHLRFQVPVGPEALQAGPRPGEFHDGAEGLRIVVLAADGETNIATQRDWAVQKSQNIAAWPSLHCERELPAGASASEFAVWVGPWWAAPPERWTLWTPGDGLCGWTADFGSAGAVGVAHNPTEAALPLDFGRMEGSWDRIALAGAERPFAAAAKAGLTVPAGAVVLMDQARIRSTG